MNTLFVTWNPNPEMFNIGGFAVRWYGLLFASGFFFGYLIIHKFFKRQGVPLKVLDKLTIYMLIGTVVGARLGHCFFYEPGYYLSKPWEILNLRQGGLASHGAAIGILLSLWIFARKQKRLYSWIVDQIVVVVALSGFFIRTGNLINSEIVGSPTNVSWAFIFPEVDTIPRHPAQIYEAGFCLFVFILLFWLYWKKNAESKPFFLTGLFLVLVFGFRFFVEFFKDVQVDFEKNQILDMGQWLSIPAVIAGAILIYYSFKQKSTPQKT
jgi:prolipoprotein diacylglyceryl transferase